MASRRLIVTNGTAAVDRIARLPIAAESTVAWSDVLHEGPVRSNLTPGQFRTRRAGFLSSRGYGDYDEILNELSSRDATLARGLSDHEEIVLWFEHDVYDQLQLIQVLDRLGARRVSADRLYLVCRREFIGESTDGALLASFDARVEIGDHHFDEAKEAWKSFGDKDPRRLIAMATPYSSKALPFLAEAFGRLAEELPHPETGLSRTERQILESLVERPATPPALFQMCQNREEAKYMGDLSFWTAMMPLWQADRPLVKTDVPPTGPNPWQRPGFLSHEFQITSAGLDVVGGRTNFIDRISLDRWLGGTHLTNASYWTYCDGELIGPCTDERDHNAT